MRLITVSMRCYDRVPARIQMRDGDAGGGARAPRSLSARYFSAFFQLVFRYGLSVSALGLDAV